MKYFAALLFIFNHIVVVGQNVFPPNNPVGIGTTTPGAGQSLNTLLHVRNDIAQKGASVLVEDEGNTGAYAAFVAKGASEGDMVLQHTRAPSGQQAFYYRVKSGNMDVINLSDNLQTINNYIFSSRYDGRMAMGFGENNTSTFPAVLNIGRLSNGNSSAYFEGNVSIGTTDPGPYMLAVKGDFVARRVRVTQGSNGSWPDYVFNSDYPLRSLDSLEGFVKRHKHLPDFLSETQVENEGIDLGEIQVALLKKVEELTLYVIQLNQAVKKLRIQNKKLLILAKLHQ